MKQTLITALVLGGLAVGTHAAVIQSVSVSGSDAYAIAPLTGTFKSGDVVDYARIQGGSSGKFTNANQVVPLFGNLAQSHSDRRQQYVGYNPTGTLGSTGAQNFGSTIPSYLLGHEYIMTMNDNRDNGSFSMTVTLDQPGRRAYMFVDTRYGDGSDQSGPTFTGTPMDSWLFADGWAPMITGAKPSDYLGVGDIIGLSASPNNSPNFGPNNVSSLTLNQYSEIWYKDIAGTSFTTGAFGPGQSYNIYGIVVGVVPEPGTGALAALGIGSLLALRRRRS